MTEELNLNLGLYTDEDTWIEFVHPETGEPIVSKTKVKMAFKTRPPQSDEAQAVAELAKKGAATRFSSQLMKRLSGSKMTKAEIDKQAASLAEAQIDRNAEEEIMKAVAMITDWRLVNVATKDDLAAPCNPETIRQLLENPANDWLKDQWLGEVDAGNYAYAEKKRGAAATSMSSSPQDAKSKTGEASSTTSQEPNDKQKNGK